MCAAMRSVLLVAAASLAVGAVGCVPLPVYKVQRSARVPRAAAPLRTGEPLAGPIALSVEGIAGGSSELGEETSALEVPRQQIRSELRIRIKRAELAPFYEQAIESSYDALDPTQAPVREGAASTKGFATRYSFATPDPNLNIGIGMEFLSYTMPYVEYRTCVEWCEENGVSGTTKYTGTESTGSLAVALTPTYRFGNVAVFGGVYGRRHPTIRRKGTEVGMEYDQDIEKGDMNWLLHAGVELNASVFSFSASIQQDLTREPVMYGPSVGLAIAVHVPELASRRPSPPAEPAPAPPSSPSWLVGSTGPIADEDLPDDPW